MPKAQYNKHTNTLKELPGMEKPVEWRQIPGFGNHYLVGSNGIIKSTDRIVTQKNGISKPYAGKKLVQYSNKGYLYVTLSGGGQQKAAKVHRVVCEAFHPNPENKPFVNHKNGIRGDNRAENLEWCTSKENRIHARDVLGVKSSVPCQGELNRNAKLSESDVYELHNHLNGGGTIDHFAEAKGLQKRSVMNILKGKSWRHLNINWQKCFAAPKRTAPEVAIVLELMNKAKAGFSIEMIQNQYHITKRQQ